MPRVVCAGHVNWDVTLRVDALPDPDGEARLRSQRGAVGGSAANVAVALSGLGVGAGLIGSVGDDEHGRRARRRLRERGVDLAGVIEAPGGTTVKYLIVDADGEVMVLGNDGVNEAVTPGDIDPGYVGDAEHVHLTAQRPETAARVAELADEGATVSVDPGRLAEERDLSAALARADIAFVTDREADALSAAVPTLVVKHGDAGAEVRTAEEVYRHPGFEVDPVDTAGAGDAFAAGFVAARLEGAGYDRALATANACGALASRSPGAGPRFDRADLDAFLAER